MCVSKKTFSDFVIFIKTPYIILITNTLQVMYIDF